MAKNDTILIDGILDDRVAQLLPSDRRDEAFEYFAFEQILRDSDLSQEEILAGSVDGRDDGGIDGFFIIVNGHPLNDIDTFSWPRSGCELDAWIITCKHHDTFRQAPLDNLVASIGELLDLGIPDSELKGSYSETLVKCRARLQVAYRKLSPRLNRFSLHLAYASRGDTAAIGASIEARANQAVGIAKTLFGNCEASFSFVGASELVAIHRNVRTFSLELPFLEALTRGERYVVLCRLSDFYAFVVDEKKKLRRYLFDSNVRAFMGLNRVNEDIRETLSNPDSPDFWWLNNGVTILANMATVTGKSIQLEGVQIVNGLQTTESIARYFGDGGTDENERSLLVKIVVSTNPSIRDAIIRATNNQTAVELTSLHATDKIQRDIEDVMLRYGLFYERRTKFYANQGHPAKLIVSPLYLASGFTSLVLKKPLAAAKLKSKLLRAQEAYDRIFPHSAPLTVWPVIAQILKKTDEVLESVRPVGHGGTERFLKSWRQITAFLAVARIFGKFSFSAVELGEFNVEALTEENLRWAWNLLQAVTSEELNVVGGGKGQRFIIAACRKAAEELGLKDLKLLEEKRAPKHGLAEKVSTKRVTPEFVAAVDQALPKQPWKPGIHKQVAQALGVHVGDVQEAIQSLIADGRRFLQRDGIVYDAEGKVIAIDEERVVRPPTA